MTQETGCRKKILDLNSILHLVCIILVLLLAIYLLTPRYWEPSAESWKQWAAASILKDTGGFPVFSLGPLYVLYLQLFSYLSYPLSMQLEYVLTHLFAAVAIYLLLRSYLRQRYALLLTIAWIPHLAVIEPGGVMAGIGFLSLYLCSKKGPLQNQSLLHHQGYFPLTLMAAALSHSVYVIFLLGHILGTLVFRWKVNVPLLNFQANRAKAQSVTRLLQAGLVIILLFTFIQPSLRPDHNHMVMDPVYAPVSLENPLQLAFFQIGNGHYMKRNFPESAWLYQDWYTTNQQAYGGAKTILQGFLNQPVTVVKNMLMNLGLGIQIPSYFFAGAYLGPVTLWLWILLLIGFWEMIRQWRQQKNIPQLCAILSGTTAALAAMTITAFNTRYVVTLLPVFLVVLSYIAVGLSPAAKTIATAYLRRWSTPDFGQKGLFAAGLVLGLVLILLGMVINEQLISSVILPYKDFRSSIQIQIFILRAGLIITGISLILFRKWLSGQFHRIAEIIDRQPQIVLKTGGDYLANLSKILLIGSVITLLITAPYPSGKIRQTEAVLQQRAFLSGAEPVSMVDASAELLSTITPNTKVLAYEHHWLQAFTFIKMDHIYQIWSLPPFADHSGEVERKLWSLDAIWISPNLATEKANIGSQSYLRYKLHLQPFLKKAIKEGWVVKKIDHYGELYIKPPGWKPVKGDESANNPATFS